MRKITLIVGAVGLLLAGHMISRTAERFPTWGVSQASAAEPASAESLLVKSDTGAWKELRLRPLSEVGSWRIECDGSTFDFYSTTLGKAVDGARDLECDTWEVSRIGGFDRK